MHNHCLQFLLGHGIVPRKIKNNAYGIFFFFFFFWRGGGKEGFTRCITRFEKIEGIRKKIPRASEQELISDSLSHALQTDGRSRPINLVQVIDCISYIPQRQASKEAILANVVQSMVTIDLFHNGGQINYSFVLMLISPTKLATTSKFQKNICFQTRAVGLININTKECKVGRHL